MHPDPNRSRQSNKTKSIAVQLTENKKYLSIIVVNMALNVPHKTNPKYSGGNDVNCRHRHWRKEYKGSIA
ncbi:hypothetical protein DSCW_52340 [Desulfosarcina widdelii]|uniref:Uncharacterized protein n=1 Tax=Desulfosarcina widdelii TaxID=947919 RepID=A0A5K7ZNM9_9BACT|nr:hypothetical protein DSCW_52340 [Desulfosarcina widdelii]